MLPIDASADTRREMYMAQEHPVCPYCYRKTEQHICDCNGNKLVCEFCNNEYRWQRNVVVTFNSHRINDDIRPDVKDNKM